MQRLPIPQHRPVRAVEYDSSAGLAQDRMGIESIALVASPDPDA